MISSAGSRPPLLVAILPAAGSKDSTAVRMVVNGTPAAATGTLAAEAVAVPLSAVLEALGLQTEWTGAAGRAVIKGGADALTLWVGSGTATAGGGEVAVSPAPRLVGGRLVVPLLPLAQALGIQVDWQPMGQTLHLQRAGAGAAQALTPTQTAVPAPAAVPAGAGAPAQLAAPAQAAPAQVAAPAQAQTAATPAQAAPTRAPSMFWAPGAGISSTRPTQAAPAAAPAQQATVAPAQASAAAPTQAAELPPAVTTAQTQPSGADTAAQTVAAETIAAQTLASPETLAAQVGSGVQGPTAVPAGTQAEVQAAQSPAELGAEIEKEAEAEKEGKKEAEAATEAGAEQEAGTEAQPAEPAAQVPHWTAPAVAPPGPPRIQWARPATAPVQKPEEIWNPPLATAPPNLKKPAKGPAAAPPNPAAPPGPPGAADPPAPPDPTGDPPPAPAAGPAPTATPAPAPAATPPRPTPAGVWPTPPSCQMKATVEMKQIREDTPDLVTDIQYPQVSDIPQVPAGKINGVLYDWAMKARTAGQKAALEGARSGYPIRPFQDYGRYDVGYNQYGLFSLYLDNYIFAGGAHGMTYRTPYTFDLNTGHHYTLQELFRPSVNYVSLLSQEIKQQMDERGLTESLLNPFTAIKPDEKFYIRDGNLVIFFDLYEYFPYAWGFQEFPIPLASLRPYLRPEFAAIPWETPCP